jgi:cell division protease FtsH
MDKKFPPPNRGRNKPDAKWLSKGPDWIVIIVIAIIWIFLLYKLGMLSLGGNFSIPYTTFKEQLRLGKVVEITVKGDRISGIFTEPIAVDGAPPTPDREKGEEKAAGGRMGIKRFKTVVPSFGDEELMPLLEEKNVVINTKAQQGWLAGLLIYLLPLLLIGGLFLYMGRKLQERMGMAGKGPLSLGQSRAKLYNRETAGITFDDVAGLESSKMELREIIEFLKDPEKFRRLGAQLPKGVLLVGPPGTGKTLMARASAGEANVPFFSISASEFIEVFVGVGASRVRDMFAHAKEEAPCIIFIDELDAIGQVRCAGIGGGHDEREQTLDQILAEMDGFTPNESVVVMAATNRPDVLDPALIRPGRFDRQVQLGLPHKKARRQILDVHTRKVPLATDVDLDAVAARTVGFSGADLHNLVNEAALLAARKGKARVETEDFDQGRDKIIMGLERENFMNDEEKRAIAYHEAGHALVAKLLPGADPIKKVSIVPRGRALGATEQVLDEDRSNITRSYLLDLITVMLGGRAADRLVYNESTAGASDDLRKTTQLVRKMVCQWGMSDTVGPIVLNIGDTHPFLGREISEPKNFSEHTSRLVDEEIRRITKEMEGRAEQLLRENRDKLDALVEALMEHETISDEEINAILGRRAAANDPPPADNIAAIKF